MTLMTRGREPPSRIQGFVLDSRVGQGGQGQVWKAHVAGEPDELRALKLIDVAEASSDERGRLRKEAEAIHRLNNKSIVRCHGTVEDYDGGWLALILDWIEGEPLSLAQDRDEMTAAQRRAIVRHLAHALAYLHGLGVLHRDIKASNVMLRPQFWEDARDPQNVVLVDFGIAVSWLDEDHERRLAIGTVSHMAPELLDPTLADGSATSGPASDVFSFGVLAWRLFTHEHPLGSDGSGAGTAKSYAEAYGLVARGVRAWPVAAAPPPPALEVVFSRCLAIRPADRASSGGEAAQLLEGARAGAGGTPEPPRVQPRPPPREANARTSGSATGSTTTATVSTLQDGRAAGAHTRSPYPWARRAMAAALAVLSLSVAGVSFGRHREGLEWRDWLFVDMDRGDGWLARSNRYRQAGNSQAAAAAWRHAASAAGDPALVKRDQALRFARTLSPHTNEVVKLWQLPQPIDVLAAPGERDQGFASVEASSVAVIGVPSVTDRKEVWFLVLVPLVSSSGKRQSHWYATAAQLGVAPNAKELAERCHRQVSGGIVDDLEATCKRAVFTADPDILASVASDLAIAYASNRNEPAAIEWLLTSYDAKPAAETGVDEHVKPRKTEQPGRQTTPGCGTPLRGELLRLPHGPPLLRFALRLAEPVALALDRHDVGVVDDALDEGRRADRCREDGVPVLEGQVGGEDEALLLIAPADDLEEQVGVSVVEGEESDLVEDEETDLGVVA